MPVNITKSVQFSGLGGTIRQSVTRSGDGGGIRQVAMPAGNAGTLSTRTGDTEGVATLGGGHGITTGIEVDVHWTGGVRRGMTVGTVSGTSVPLTDSGSGDALPAQSTPIVVTQRVSIDVEVVGDNVQLLAVNARYASAGAGAPASVDFLDGGDSTIAALRLEGNVPREYDVAGGADNPFAGETIQSLKVSNGHATLPATLQLVWNENTAS